MHTSVTNTGFILLLNRNHKNPTIMRTLNSDQLTERVATSKGYAWNAKRRYR